jgi:alkyl hydroperoxide reductase subunit AhpC
MIAFENLSSTAWLRNYRSSKGITYPMVLDSLGQVFSQYRVGSVYGNVVPTCVLVDKQGVVRHRTDGVFNTVAPLSAKITELLAEP